MTTSLSQRRATHKRALAKAKRDAAEYRAEVAARREAEAAELAAHVAARKARDAAAHRDIDSLAPGDLVRTSIGWHRVVRVNAKSVTVETGWSWTDRYPLDRIIETRKPQRGDGVA